MTTAIARERRGSPAVAALLLLAVGYNFLLALFNASVHPVGASSAYAVELAIYAGCFLFGLRSLGREGQLLVFTGLGLVLAFNLLRFLETWSFDLKLVRDAVIPFAFLTLGTAYRGRLHKLVLWLAVIVVLVAVFEMAFPNLYGDLVDPRSYFVNTRGNSEDDFWNEASKLYVSATRPGERNWLGGFELPRVSSIFVEPVTMGNFIIFFCAVAITFWRSLRVPGVVFSLALILFLLIASDGRLASATCLLMLILAPLLRRVDQSLAAFLFIGVLLAGWLAVWALGVTAYEDTMMGRVFVSVDAIGAMSPREWFGMDLAAPYRYSDSGIAYFIAGQSILVVLVFLIAYSFLLKMPTSNGQLFKNLFVVAFALSLLVSNAYFSIKTAGLWWFACGYFWRLQIPQTALAPRNGPDVRETRTFGSAQAAAPS
ncbi:MAG TPA: polysaccharide biosynthesis protein GumE [Pseudoxanthomonas sp.]